MAECNMNLFPIILFGEAVTRLCPLSQGDHPKQFLKLTSDKTVIQETLLRLKGFEFGKPIVSCGEAHRFLLAQQVSVVIEQMNLPFDKVQGPQILLEPMAKNTAPAIAVACCATMMHQIVIKCEDVITLDTTTYYIHVGKRTIATIGLDGIVIVDSNDALLEAAKGKIQDVKKVIETI